MQYYCSNRAGVGTVCNLLLPKRIYTVRYSNKETRMQFQPWDNPMGTDGFEFVEYAAPDPKALGALFERMGFKAIAKHRHKNVTLYRQGGINFIINGEADSFAQRFARHHGPSVCAIAIRVQTDIKTALCFASLTQVGIIVVEIGLGLRYVALIHILGHGCLRSMQFVRAPSLLLDYRTWRTPSASGCSSLRAFGNDGSRPICGPDFIAWRSNEAISMPG